jgi:hypothetical protein
MRTDQEQFRYIAEQIVEVERRHRPLLRQVYLSPEVRREMREAHRMVDLLQRLARRERLPTAAEVRQLRERALAAAEAVSQLAGTTPAERDTIEVLALNYHRIADAAEAIHAVRPLVPRGKPDLITVQHPDSCPGCGRQITARVEGRLVVVEVLP